MLLPGAALASSLGDSAAARAVERSASRRVRFIMPGPRLLRSLAPFRNSMPMGGGVKLPGGSESPRRIKGPARACAGGGVLATLGPSLMNFELDFKHQCGAEHAAPCFVFNRTILTHAQERAMMLVLSICARCISASTGSTTSFLPSVRYPSGAGPPIQRRFFLDAAILSRMRSPVTSRSKWAKERRTLSGARSGRRREGR